MSAEEAHEVLKELFATGQTQALSSAASRRTMEAFLVRAEVDPDRIRSVLEEYFGPLD